MYQWLETLEMDSLVTSKQISDWLASNPQVMDRLVEKHSKYHLIHYSQRMHLKLLKKRGKLPKVQNCLNHFDWFVGEMFLFSVYWLNLFKPFQTILHWYFDINYIYIYSLGDVWYSDMFLL